MNYNLFLYILVGFLAQLIDGALGMAYGVSCTTFLISFAAVPPKIASASVHTAEVFTTFVSGISHWRAKNVDWSIFKRLLVPGVIGGAFGAFILVNVNTKYISPIVNVYLIIMGVVIIIRAFKKITATILTGNKIIPIGFVGGTMDAIGGGGWGPIVTSTMVASGHPPRYTIGSVNMAEFFVTFVQTLTFSIFISIADYWQIILGLAIGGVIAAPLAAIICKRVAAKKIMLAVGILIAALNIRSLILLFL